VKKRNPCRVAKVLINISEKKSITLRHHNYVKQTKKIVKQNWHTKTSLQRGTDREIRTWKEGSREQGMKERKSSTKNTKGGGTKGEGLEALRERGR